MGLRFRRSIKLGKGLRLNIGKTGVSLSTGIRGLNFTSGTKNSAINIGIPGTGISYRHTVNNKSHSVNSDRSSQCAEITAKIGIDNEGTIYITDMQGNPLPENIIRRVKREYKSQIEQLYLDANAEVNNETEQLLNIHKSCFPLRESSEWEEMLNNKQKYNRLLYNQLLPCRDIIADDICEKYLSKSEKKASGYLVVSIFIFLMYIISLIEYSIDSEMNPLLIPMIFASVATFLLHLNEKRIMKKVKVKADKEIENAYQDELSRYEDKKKLHEELEDKNEKEFNDREEERILFCKRLMSGDTEAMADVLESALEEAEFPLETISRFDIKSENKVLLDIDLPEIKDMPLPKSNILSSGKVSIKNKTQKEIKEQYATAVHGIAFKLASIVFNHLKTCEEVIVSGYTQRADKKTGSIGDEYIYSIAFDKHTFYSLNFQYIDPIQAFDNFTYHRDMLSDFTLKEIEPIDRIRMSED